MLISSRHLALASLFPLLFALGCPAGGGGAGAVSDDPLVQASYQAGLTLRTEIQGLKASGGDLRSACAAARGVHLPALQGSSAPAAVALVRDLTELCPMALLQPKPRSAAPAGSPATFRRVGPKPSLLRGSAQPPSLKALPLSKRSAGAPLGPAPKTTSTAPAPSSTTASPAAPAPRSTTAPPTAP